jgi:crotonobetainyl-CoA:carnitine CoA-transferase CaiB-like acyl-CoA transferase
MGKDKGAESKQLLSGVRVLDLTQYLAGPFCTRLLKDLGAEVIKIEPPPLGDGARYLPYITKGYSGYFIQNNCGKRSLCLNLKTQRGKEIFKKLVSISDVCVENFTPGVMKKLGLDYETLEEINPRLIMCSISGFGQSGPWAHQPGWAATAHAVSGLMWVTGKSNNPDDPPRPPGAAFGDTGASLHALGAICAALYFREKTGRGEYIDMALLDALFDQQDSAIEIYVMSEGKDTSALLSPVYEGRDGYATIIVNYSDRDWEKLVKAINRPELLEDEWLAKMENRMMNRDIIVSLINEWVQSFEHIDDAMAILEEAGIVSTRILSISEAINHPQIQARDMMIEIDHPILGKVPVVNSPFRLKHTKAGLEGLPPEIGEHNEEILSNLLGYSAEDISELKRENVIYKVEKDK